VFDIVRIYCRKKRRRSKCELKRFISHRILRKYINGRGDEKQVAAGVLRDAGTAMGK